MFLQARRNIPGPPPMSGIRWLVWHMRVIVRSIPPGGPARSVWADGTPRGSSSFFRSRSSVNNRNMLDARDRSPTV